MPTTSNFGWTTPADTDLVKDGAAAIRTLGNGVDASFVDLKGGTTGQILSKNSNTDLDFVWIANDQGDITAVTAGTGLSGGGTSGAVTLTNAMATEITASGDIIVGTGSGTFDNLPIGTTGQVLTADTTVSPYKVKWANPSSAATNWTMRFGNGSDGNGLYTFAFNGSNLYVAAGANGYLYTSSDGKTWTSRTSGFGSIDIQKVAFGNGLFVAVGNNGTLTTSTDGITWTARTANMSTNTIFDVAYANGTWVAVGNGGGATNTGGITYSTDGITWTRKSQTPSIGTSYLAVAYNGTNWIVGASLSTNNALYASTPSGTWTAFIGAGGSSAICWLASDGTRTFACDAGQLFYFTTSSTFASWQSITGPTAGTNSTARQKSYISYYNNTIYYINNLYWQSFSTNNIVDQLPASFSTIDFLPSNMVGSGSSINTYGYVIFACATGLLFGGSYQWIWTSF